MRRLMRAKVRPFVSMRDAGFRPVSIGVGKSLLPPAMVEHMNDLNPEISAGANQ